MSLITTFDPWKSKLCTCPLKYSFSPYTGCGHNCIYCYASSYIPNFFSPRPKKELLTRLQREIKEIPPHSIITLSNSSDPYQPLERRLTLTRRSLEMLRNYPLRVKIVTKSSLLLRDIDILKHLSAVVISITITTLNEKIAQRLEPSAPSPLLRLNAIKSLSQYFPVVCRFDPIIYPLNIDEVKDVITAIKKVGVRQVITSTYKVKTDNLKRMFVAFPEYRRMWKEFYLKKGEKYGNYIYLNKDLRYHLLTQIRKIALFLGLDFSTCREGFSFLNTKPCDGSGWFL